MPSKFPAKQVWFLALLLIGSIPARAQLDIDPTLERGMKPYGTFEGGAIDSVSMTNGDLNLHIPLVSYPQRGGKLHLGFYAMYQNGSSVVTPTGLGCSQPPHVCGWGTQVNPSGLAIEPDIGLSAFVSGVIPPFNGPYATIQTPDRSLHEMAFVSGGGRSIDATGYLCLNNCATVIDRDGIRYSNFTTGSLPLRIEDPNGNFIAVTAPNNGSATSSYLDTMGRTVSAIPTSSTTDFSGCTGSLPIASASLWTLPGYQGGTLAYKFCYATIYFGEQTCRHINSVTTCV